MCHIVVTWPCYHMTSYKLKTVIFAMVTVFYPKLSNNVSVCVWWHALFVKMVLDVFIIWTFDYFLNLYFLLLLFCCHWYYNWSSNNHPKCSWTVWSVNQWKNNGKKIWIMWEHLYLVKRDKITKLSLKCCKIKQYRAPRFPEK